MLLLEVVEVVEVVLEVPIDVVLVVSGKQSVVLDARAGNLDGK
jgi:hypothetical protein